MTIRGKILLIVSLAFFCAASFWLAFVVATLRAHAETNSNFSFDVEQGIQGTKQNGTNEQNDAINNIKAQDYKTSWDEFGTNVLVDGGAQPADIRKDVVNDIITDLQTQLTYDQKDAQYLESRHSSPEEVMTLEDSGGNDILPENYVDPHPSLDANPEVNPSSLDVPITATDTPVSDEEIISDISSSTTDTAISDTSSSSPDTLVPPGGEWNPPEVKVFETVLNADVSTQNTDVSNEPPGDTTPAPPTIEDQPAHEPTPPPPPADVPPPETTSSPVPAPTN